LQEKEPMFNYEIIPVKVGEFLEHEKSKLTYGCGFGVKLRTPITIFVIKGEGRLILVDTGTSDVRWSWKYHSSAIVQTEDMKILNALNNLGIKPDDFSFIINTHLHYDHAFGNALFPGKEIYVQKKEVEFADEPLPSFYYVYESEQIGMYPQWKYNRNSLRVIDGDATVAPGIELIFLPGHSPGSQGGLVDTIAGRYLIAGDFIGCKENWLGNDKHKHIPPGTNVSQYDCFESFKKIESLDIGNRVLPSHDMSLFDHPVYPYETCGHTTAELW
jgi:glyoxylase-like metal-dependent hydrolase (beta-lactamase superfamily II)